MSDAELNELAAGLEKALRFSSCPDWCDQNGHTKSGIWHTRRTAVESTDAQNPLTGQVVEGIGGNEWELRLTVQSPEKVIDIEAARTFAARILRGGAICDRLELFTAESPIL
jgi:hypothetical protein